MHKTLVCCDVQAPYHDPDATEILCQIGEDLKPDLLIDNGDFHDWLVLSTRFPIRTESDRFVSSLKSEVEIQANLREEIVRRIKPKRKRFHQGNHEWRLFRAMMQSRQVNEAFGEGFDRNKLWRRLNLSDWEMAGEYPEGSFIFPGRAPDKNVWVEHGYQVRKKAGFMAQALIEERMTNVVTGHVERLAIVWRRAIGRREFFGVESGNLSLFARDDKAAGIYSTYPFNQPMFLQKTQGFLIIEEYGGDYFPELVRIRNGKTVWRGRVYKA